MIVPARVAHYRVLERIGRGGMADVHAAYDETLQRDVVLKFIDRGRLADDTARRIFAREARSAAAVSHPFLCGLYEVLESDGRPVVAMERIHGQTILQRTAGAPLDPREVCRLGREMAEALAAAHARGLVHRNVSASNVMIGADGHAKVMDLGLAHVVGGDDRSIVSDPRVDGPSPTMLVGTPGYMAPEILHGGRATPKSDLYAAGVVLYRMATGAMPFAARLTPESVAEILLQPPVPPSLLVAGLPPSLDRAIMGLLEKRPEARFPSAGSLAATLAVPERGERLDL